MVFYLQVLCMVWNAKHFILQELLVPPMVKESKDLYVKRKVVQLHSDCSVQINFNFCQWLDRANGTFRLKFQDQNFVSMYNFFFT
jgi:hypothetical protein